MNYKLFPSVYLEKKAGYLISATVDQPLCSGLCSMED